MHPIIPGANCDPSCRGAAASLRVARPRDVVGDRWRADLEPLQSTRLEFLQYARVFLPPLGTAANSVWDRSISFATAGKEPKCPPRCLRKCLSPLAASYRRLSLFLRTRKAPPKSS